MRNEMPPMGVMAPNQRTPVRLRKVETTGENNYPDDESPAGAVEVFFRPRVIAQATAMSPRAWYIW